MSAIYKCALQNTFLILLGLFLGACGQAKTYGTAPGALLAVEEPTPTPPVVLVDAGLEIDAGPACIPGQQAQPSFAESEAYFTTTGLTEKLSACASCHKSGTPAGIGIAWGTPDDNASGWHAAFRTLYEAEISDPSTVTLGPNVSDVVNVFSEGHQAQADADRRADAEAWIVYINSEVGEPVVCDEPVEPLCVPSAGGLPDEPTQREKFVLTSLPDVFNGNCTGCHGGKSPDSQGFAWGASGASGEAWFDAVSAVIARNAVAQAADHTLVVHLENGHSGSVASSTGATEMTEFLTFTTTDAPAVVCE